MVRRIYLPGTTVPLDEVIEHASGNAQTARSIADGTEVALVAPRSPLSMQKKDDFYPIAVSARALRSDTGVALTVVERVRVTDVSKAGDGLRAVVTPWDDVDVAAGTQLWTEVRDTLSYTQVVNRHVPPEQVRALLKELEASPTSAVVAGVLDRMLGLPYLALSIEERAALLCEPSLKRRIEHASAWLRRTIDQRMQGDAAHKQGVERAPAPAPPPPPSPPPRAPVPQPPARPPPSQPQTAYDRPVKSLPVMVQLAIHAAMEAGTPMRADFLRMVPWNWTTPSHYDVAALAARLERIVGLGEAKEQLLSVATALRTAGNERAKPVCLVGPASVDKVVIAHAVADAFGRPFARVALNGATARELRGAAPTVDDELTPGRFAVALAEAAAANAVLLLDDVDGVHDADAIAALAEALDPARHKGFADAYLGIGLDLSRTLLVATASDPSRIPSAIAQATHAIALRGYTTEEKATLVRERLWPSALSAAGATAAQVTLTPAAVQRLARRYAGADGVAGFGDVLARLAQSIAVDLRLGAGAVAIDAQDLTKRIGPPTDGALDVEPTVALQTTSDSTQPTRLGSYHLLERIGEGGMAEVFVAESGSGGSRVAIKRLRPDMTREPGFREMFHDEARLASRLRHPNIVPIIEIGDDRGTPFLVMELCRGVSLARVRKHVRMLDPDLAVVVCMQVLAALHYAHELKDAAGNALGVVHRDISPHNLMLDPSGDVRLLDFGIARAAGRSTNTATGVVKGKVAYMAPEQLDGTEDRRADLFAVGVVLCELLCAERHVSGDDMVMMKKLMRRDYALPEATRELPAELRAVLERAIAADPVARFATAGEMAGALAWAMPSDIAEARLRLAELVRVVGEPVAVTGTRTLPNAADQTPG